MNKEADILARTIYGEARGESISGSITCNGSCSLIEYDRNNDRFEFKRIEV